MVLNILYFLNYTSYSLKFIYVCLLLYYYKGVFERSLVDLSLLLGITVHKIGNDRNEKCGMQTQHRKYEAKQTVPVLQKYQKIVNLSCCKKWGHTLTQCSI